MRLHIVFFKTRVTDQTGIAMGLNMTNMFAINFLFDNRKWIMMVKYAPWS